MPNTSWLEFGRHDWFGDCMACVGRARACVLVSRRHRTGESPRDLRSLMPFLVGHTRVGPCWMIICLGSKTPRLDIRKHLHSPALYGDSHMVLQIRSVIENYLTLQGSPLMQLYRSAPFRPWNLLTSGVLDQSVNVIGLFSPSIIHPLHLVIQSQLNIPTANPWSSSLPLDPSSICLLYT
ncbi:Uncharacterized protein HZ326_21873, partial [Fusarium oxysporum f. sp. albedinis]